MLHKALPKLRILFVSAKPSLARDSMRFEMAKLNRLVLDFIDTNELLDYIDVHAPMLGDDGEVRPDIFIGDGLHMNAEGYKIWAATIRPGLEGKKQGK